MSNGASLDRLADIAGVEAEYWDIWGNHHPIGADAKRRILAALGVPAGDGTAIAAGIRRLEDEPWLRPLPLVQVIWEGDRQEVALRLAQDRAEWPVTLLIEEENGTPHEFLARPSEAPVRERRTIDGREFVRVSIGLPLALPLGYHEVYLEGDPHRSMQLIVAPKTCHLPPGIAGGGRTWGVSAQLYSLKRPGNWGIGDFTDLFELVDASADLGAGVVGLNPLHALFLAYPEFASPYSPNSRLFLNPLYIDVEAIEGYAGCAEAQSIVAAAADEIAFCRGNPQVAYRRVKPIKLAVLDALWVDFHARMKGEGAGDPMVADFARFCAEQGEPLRRWTIFEALTEAFPSLPWQTWPEAYRHPESAEVADFAARHEDRIGFFAYLQWQADRQLARTQARAEARGMAIGVYRDLAVGAARDGADAWSDQEAIVQDAKVGCPPDPFNMLGQDWGIPPLHPLLLREKRYAPFIAMLRANMRHAGGLRIDHVMGLMHLFWIPADGKPADGAYVEYPFDEMLAILALESQRQRCLVVGEDLGTVPPGFRERMAEMNVLSYRVLYFEKDGDRFKRPDEYPPLALACVTTHDLATLVGFWKHEDIELKRRLQLYPSASDENGERGARIHDRWLLLQALSGQGLLPKGIDPNNVDATAMTPELIAALHTYLARSPARILLVQVDDLMQEAEQINLPGTVDERPNWRRRLSMQVADLADSPVMRALRPGLASRSAPADEPVAPAAVAGG